MLLVTIDPNAAGFNREAMLFGPGKQPGVALFLDYLRQTNKRTLSAFLSMTFLRLHHHIVAMLSMFGVRLVRTG